MGRWNSTRSVPWHGWVPSHCSSPSTLPCCWLRGDDATILHRQQRCMSMKAVICEAFGGPEVLALRDLPDPPPPGPGEIQVRIGARGVQYVDVLILAGKYQFRPEPPSIPGGEAAGVVAAVGTGVTGFQQGDRVMSRHTLGACAELG